MSQATSKRTRQDHFELHVVSDVLAVILSSRIIPQNNVTLHVQHLKTLLIMPAPAPHKPRRKVKKSNDSDFSSTASLTRSGVTKPAYPLASLLWPARTSVSQWEILPLILMAVGLLRWAAGLWGYSGMLVQETAYASRINNIFRF